MPQVVNITGQRFGRLVTVRRVKNDKDGRSRWLCKCDCGNCKVIYKSSLVSGNTQSCGCLMNEIHGSIAYEISQNKAITRNKKNTVWVTYHGETRPLIDFIEEAGLNYSTVYNRINKHGWSVEDALTVPVQR